MSDDHRIEGVEFELRGGRPLVAVVGPRVSAGHPEMTDAEAARAVASLFQAGYFTRADLGYWPRHKALLYPEALLYPDEPPPA